MLAGAAYVAAAVVLWVLLRPDPCCSPVHCRRQVAAPGNHANSGSSRSSGCKSIWSRRWSWALVSGAGILILTQLIMVAIMTMTLIHIEHHGHSIGVTGVVIAAHVAGMFLPSPVSGWLVDRLATFRSPSLRASLYWQRACSPRGLRWIR